MYRNVVGDSSKFVIMDAVIEPCEGHASGGGKCESKFSHLPLLTQQVRQKGERMGLAVAALKKGEGRILKAGGMWVFDNEIASIMGNFENGDIVLVRDFDGYPMERDLSIPIPRLPSVCLPEMRIQKLTLRLWNKE